MSFSHILLLLFLMLIWGFNFVVIKVGVDGMQPIFFSFVRFFLASIPAIFFVKRPRVPWKVLIRYGLVMFAAQYALLFLGMYAGITAGLASLILQVQIFFTALLGILFFHEKPHSWQIIGALVAFSGIALIVFNLDESTTLPAFFLVVAAAATWSTGNLISKKIGAVNMLGLVVWGSLIAWPPLLLLSLGMEGIPQFDYSWSAISSALYIAYFSTLLGFGIWSWFLHHYPLSTVAPFTLLAPVIAMGSSALVLGEPLQSWKIIAACLIITGLLINLFGSRFFRGC